MTKDLQSKISFDCHICEASYRMEQSLNTHLLFKHQFLRSECSTGIHLDRFNQMKNKLQTLRDIKYKMIKRKDNYYLDGRNQIRLTALALKLINEIKSLGYDKVRVPDFDYSCLNVSYNYEYAEIQEILDGVKEVII